MLAMSFILGCNKDFDDADILDGTSWERVSSEGLTVYLDFRIPDFIYRRIDENGRSQTVRGTYSIKENTVTLTVTENNDESFTDEYDDDSAWPVGETLKGTITDTSLSIVSGGQTSSFNRPVPEIVTVSLEEAKAIQLELYHGFGYYSDRMNADNPRRDCGFYSLAFSVRTGAYLVLQNQGSPANGVYFLQKYDLPESFIQYVNGVYGGIYAWNDVYFIAYPEFGAYTLLCVAAYKPKDRDAHAFNLLHGVVFDLTRGDNFVPRMPGA